MRSVEVGTFYNTKAWQECRNGYFKSKGGLCERCLNRGLIVPGVIVHHKIYLNAENVKDPTIALNWDNLELLCEEDHNREHFKGKGNNRRYKISEDGEVIILDDRDL